jgi:signal transduction histidine kinase/CheY-like chemotaxis protein
MPAMPPTPDETQNLRRCVRDLVALSTLPAIWGNADAPTIGRSLAEVLLRLLSVDFVYVRLPGRAGRPPAEAARTRRRTESAGRAHEIGQALAPWLQPNGAGTPPSIPSPVGDETVRLAVFPIGPGHDHGLLAAGCARPDFPTDTERLLLGVAVNQAAGLLQRKETEEALREADRRKDEFLATLAHELRNPLAPLRNGLQVMKLARGDAKAVEQARGMMERQLAQMVRLIDDLLDVSRITRGKLRLRRERVELAEVVRSAVEGSRPLLEAQVHRLTVALPPEPVYLDADPTRLAQVLGNLLTNAAKYTDRGGNIALTAGRQGGAVVVSVKDNGIGIAAEHLPGLFEMFSQVAPAQERSQGGLGLGLALVKGLVEMHGGTVEARSGGPGQGSEFLVRLPPATGPSIPGPAAPADRGEGAPPCRILIADDNRDVVDSLAMLLRLQNHVVQVARDGREAVEAAGRFRPDVVFLDIGMPALNGLQAARQIRNQPGGEEMLLVAITGWGQDEDRRRATEAGFDHHLTKPVDPAAVERLLADLKAHPAPH